MSVEIRKPSVLRLCGIASVTSIAMLLIVVSDAQAFGNNFDKLDPGALVGREGLSVVDVRLPLDFRARIAGFYTQTRYAVDALAFDRLLRPGPAMRDSALLESHFSVVRPLWDGVELEINWVMRNSLSTSPSMHRQTLGFFIRFVH